MIRIGLTGGVASGKSLALSMMKDLNCQTISSDDIVHYLMKNNKQLISKLKITFNCVDDNGVVDRKKLGKLIFNNKDAKKKLESIVHPLVRIVRTEFFKKAEFNSSQFAVYETPLLFEIGILSEFDFSILIHSPLEQRINRFISRGSGDEQKFWEICKNQELDLKKSHKADFVINNNGDPQLLKQNIQNVLQEIIKRKNNKA